MGYAEDLVASLPSEDDLEWSLERFNRHADEEDLPFDHSASTDPSMRPVWLTEAIVKADADGDGVPEWNRVVVGGSGEANVLLERSASRPPTDHFSALSPILMPHKFWGRGLAELVMEWQLVKSTILRQILDYLYITNNPRYGVLDNAVVDYDDLLTNRPGGVVRMKGVSQVGQALLPMPQPQMSPAVFNLLEYIQSLRENASGITAYSQGLDADALNKTATGVNLVTQASNARIELIARVFAETGVRDLFRAILRLVTAHQDKPEVVRLRNKWVPMDPSVWDPEMDVSADVGLGTGNRDQQMAYLMLILNLQKEALGNGAPGVTWKHLYNTAAKLVALAGLKTIEPYWSDPEAAPAVPAEDPLMAMEAARVRLEQEKLQAEVAKDQADVRLKDMELRLKAQRLQGEQLEKAADRAERTREKFGDVPVDSKGLPAQIVKRVIVHRDANGDMSAADIVELPVEGVA
jgi:hypothetical protein